jgi:hypothetical protein
MSIIIPIHNKGTLDFIVYRDRYEKGMNISVCNDWHYHANICILQYDNGKMVDLKGDYIDISSFDRIAIVLVNNDDKVCDEIDIPTDISNNLLSFLKLKDKNDIDCSRFIYFLLTGEGHSINDTEIYVDVDDISTVDIGDIICVYDTNPLHVAMSLGKGDIQDNSILYLNKVGGMGPVTVMNIDNLKKYTYKDNVSIKRILSLEIKRHVL